jgi:hypothetical protein
VRHELPALGAAQEYVFAETLHNNRHSRRQ